MTDVRSFYESKYLGAWNVPEEGKDYVVTIARVVPGTIVGQGGRQDKKAIIYFTNTKDPSKPMVVNKTNLKIIGRVLGTFEDKEWAGRSIVLFRGETVRDGEVTPSLCIRPYAPKAGQQPAAPETMDSPREPGDETSQVTP